MSPRNCFGVILRTVGLIALTASALYIYSTIVVILHPSAATEFSILSYVFAPVVTFAIGLYFLKGAPHVINFAYGHSDSLEYGTEIIDSGAEVVEQQLHLCSFCGKSHAEVKKTHPRPRRLDLRQLRDRLQKHPRERINPKQICRQRASRNSAAQTVVPKYSQTDQHSRIQSNYA